MFFHNLPLLSTSFVGRKQEISDIKHLLSNPECRLITLIGPGGIGKTRLALAIVERLVATSHADESRCTFPNGVIFVPLQPIIAAENILHSIVGAAGLQFHENGSSEQQLLGFLSQKRMLLILDNFEHVLAGIDLIEAVLANAPQIRILVTSQEPLKLAREWRYEVRGLAVPSKMTIDLEEYDAVQLFAKRARQIRHDFSLIDELDDVLQVCQLVGGMPLAIELVVSWLHTLSVAEIKQEITGSLDILATNLHDVEERHRNIRAVLDTAWQRLDKHEQRSFIRLSVFRGGFSREAASAVCDVNLQTLVALVNKSLVRVDAVGRYNLHEMAQKYGYEKLVTDIHTIKSTLARHCTFYPQYLQQQLERIAVDDQREILSDMDNLRQAWQWTLENQKWEELQQMAEGLYWLYEVQGWYREGVESFSQAEISLDKSSSDGDLPLIYGYILCCQGAFLCNIGEHKKGTQQIARGIALLRDQETPTNLLASALLIGVQMNAIEDTNAAKEQIEEANALAKSRVEQWRIALNLYVLAFHYYFVYGEWETAQEYYQEANNIFRQIGGRRGIAMTLDGLGSIAKHTGDHVTAREMIQEALIIQQETTSPPSVVTMTWELGLIAWQAGEYKEADQYYQTSLRLAQEISYQHGIAWNLSALSLLASEQGNQQLAKKRAKASLVIWQTQRDPLAYIGILIILSIISVNDDDYTEAKRYCYEALIATQQTKTGKPFVDAPDRECIVAIANLYNHTGNQQWATELLGLAFAQPWPWGGQERKPIYTRLQRTLQSTMGTNAYQSAWDHGQTLDLETTLKVLLQEFTPLMTHTPQTLEQPLTNREIDVLQLLADGFSNRDIGIKLHLSVGTVKVHTRNIYRKLGVNNRDDAASLAQNLDLL